MRHGLFAVDVFAGGAGVFEDVAMLVVGDGDNNGIDVFAIEDGAIFAGDVDAGVTDSLAGGGVAAVVEIAGSDAFHSGDESGGLEKFTSAHASSDGSKANGITGRDGTSGGKWNAGARRG